MRLVIQSWVLALAIGALGIKQAQAIQIGQPAPEISGSSWLNSQALSAKELKGRVVLVEFWTYG